MSILDCTLKGLKGAFGEPVCRGDSCWWTLSRDQRRPVRLSVFIDADGRTVDYAEGWLCDLQDPTGTTRHFFLNDEAQIEPLIERVRRMVAEPERSHASHTSGAEGAARSARAPPASPGD